MQTRKLPPLASLRAFEATARHMSAKRAAQELSVTPTAISHQLRQLEAWLEQPLFIRQPRQLILTEAGRQLFEALRQGFDLIAQALAGLRAARARPMLTISTTPTLAARWLLPRFKRFHAAHSGYDLRLHSSYDVVPLDGRGADVAIRYGGGEWPGLVAEKLFDVSFAPVCSPRLNLREPAELLHHTLLHYEWQEGVPSPATWLAWRKLAGLRGLKSSAGPVFSDENHAVAAAIAGHGVALIDSVSIAAELKAGLLVQAFGPHMPGLAYYLVYPEARRGEALMASLLQWLREPA